MNIKDFNIREEFVNPFAPHFNRKPKYTATFTDYTNPRIEKIKFEELTPSEQGQAILLTPNLKEFTKVTFRQHAIEFAGERTELEELINLMPDLEKINNRFKGYERNISLKYVSD